MILGWRYGNSIGNYILVDSKFPHMALHHGRLALKTWTEGQNKRRNELRDAGPWRRSNTTDWDGLTTAVCEFGDVVLRILPIGSWQEPRAWTSRDAMWREPLTELRRFVGQELKCCSRLEFMPGGEVYRFTTPPALVAVNGFIGWRKGEAEPSARLLRDLRIIRSRAA